MEFDVPISVTHKIDNSVLRNKWPEDLSIHTLRFFPKQSGNTLPALSFLAPRSTGDSICEHMHDTKKLISYLQNKHESEHACPQCEIEEKIGNKNGKKKAKPEVEERKKKAKPEVEEWERKNDILGTRRFTTKVYDPNSNVLDNEDIEALAKFCVGLEDYSMPLLTNRNEKKKHWLILANDITELQKQTVGFAFFTDEVMMETMILGRLNRRELEDIFYENDWILPSARDHEERWRWGAFVILDYVNDRTKIFAKGIDTADPDYEEYKFELSYLTQTLRFNLDWPDQDIEIPDEQWEEIAHVMLTYKAIVLVKKVVTKALIFVNLICADPKYKGMGVSKGVFRRLQKRVIELAQTGPADTIAVIELTPVKERKPLYESYGFVPLDEREDINFPNKAKWTSGDLMKKELDIAN